MSTEQDFKSLLAKLVKTPEHFTQEDIKSAFNDIFPLTPSQDGPAVPDAQVAAFLTAMHLLGVDRRAEVLAAVAGILRERAVRANVIDYDKDFVVDIVGTGGDGHNTFNVSTTAAIVAAGAGARVCKASRCLFSTMLTA